MEHSAIQCKSRKAKIQRSRGGGPALSPGFGEKALCQIRLFWFAHQQMHEFGHDEIANHLEYILAAHTL